MGFLMQPTTELQWLSHLDQSLFMVLLLNHEEILHNKKSQERFPE